MLLFPAFSSVRPPPTGKTEMVIFDQLTGFYDDTVLSAPPENEAELLTRAQALAGYTLSELAQQAGIPTPADLRRDKGWVGMLLEIHLGASAAASRNAISPILA